MIEGVILVRYGVTKIIFKLSSVVAVGNEVDPFGWST